MSDFLVQFNPSAQGSSLLNLLNQPYGAISRPGKSLTFPWGGAAVLQEKVSKQSNIVTNGKWTFAWAGELIISDAKAALESALTELNALPITSTDTELFGTLKYCGLLAKLNGAFAICLVGPSAAVFVTDPMGSVQLYAGRSTSESLAAVGTHPDIVARVCGDYAIDPVSVCDFLNTGTPCCPHTMHANVKEVWPGTVCIVRFENGGPKMSEFRYWEPPDEVTTAAGQAELVDEFVEAWPRAVRSRCEGDRLAIQLSGGMDSRLIAAVIPPTDDCVAVTLCDSMNREARFARRVAACYGRKWIPLTRDLEYLGRTVVDCTRFTGCEGEFHHGHMAGFAGQIAEMHIDSLFSGLLMDNNFKGYYARDFVRVARLGGLLPATHKAIQLDYVDMVSPFCTRYLQPQGADGIRDRRRRFQQGHFATKRQSKWEWLDGFPNSQSCDNTGWVVERRVLPLKLPVMDRSLVELAFKAPMSFKAGGAFFEAAAVRILQNGRRIPSANDGVRLGSSHISRLAQRAIRKTQTTTRNLLAAAGVKFDVPHSWHDFPRYLQESRTLTDLIAQYGSRLRDFDGVFRDDPTTLIRNREVPWPVGYRLIQLATWRGLLDTYRI